MLSFHAYLHIPLIYVGTYPTLPMWQRMGSIQAKLASPAQPKKSGERKRRGGLKEGIREGGASSIVFTRSSEPSVMPCPTPLFFF